MKALFVTDLHGATWKYEHLFRVAQETRTDVVINGGDMLPKARNLFSQGGFITNYLDKHFEGFDAAGIYYLCYLGNDDLRIFDEAFQKTCDKYPFMVNLAQHRCCY
jgi:Icc-related predicted phosphoesterase